MSTVKFRKVPELFPNRKVRTVRTEQLWGRVVFELCEWTDRQTDILITILAPVTEKNNKWPK